MIGYSKFMQSPRYNRDNKMKQGVNDHRPNKGICTRGEGHGLRRPPHWIRFTTASTSSASKSFIAIASTSCFMCPSEVVPDNGVMPILNRT